jgi:hypothetical protein
MLKVAAQLQWSARCQTTTVVCPLRSVAPLNWLVPTKFSTMQILVWSRVIHFKRIPWSQISGSAGGGHRTARARTRPGAPAWRHLRPCPPAARWRHQRPPTRPLATLARIPPISALLGVRPKRCLKALAALRALQCAMTSQAVGCASRYSSSAALLGRPSSLFRSGSRPKSST